MVTMQRKERPGDRARTRIHVPGGAVIPTFKDGMVTVRVESERAVKALKRRKHGFAVVVEPEVAPPVEAAPPPIDTPKPSAGKGKGKGKSKAPTPKAPTDDGASER